MPSLSFSLRPDFPRILAIAGGSCSGKTTLATTLQDYLGPNMCRVVRQDDYYHDIRDRGGSPLMNFDVPDALDFDLLEENLLTFKRNEATALPNYNFTTHKRQTPSAPLNPKPLIIVEGLLLLTQPKLRQIFDQSVFIECGAEMRLERRLERDTEQRGRSRSDVLRQFHDQVEPAQQAFVSPSKIHADLIIRQSESLSNMAQVVNVVVALLNEDKTGG